MSQGCLRLTVAAKHEVFGVLKRLTLHFTENFLGLNLWDRAEKNKCMMSSGVEFILSFCTPCTPESVQTLAYSSPAHTCACSVLALPWRCRV